MAGKGKVVSSTLNAVDKLKVGESKVKREASVYLLFVAFSWSSRLLPCLRSFVRLQLVHEQLERPLHVGNMQNSFSPDHIANRIALVI